MNGNYDTIEMVYEGSIVLYDSKIRIKYMKNVYQATLPMYLRIGTKYVDIMHDRSNILHRHYQYEYHVTDAAFIKILPWDTTPIHLTNKKQTFDRENTMNKQHKIIENKTLDHVPTLCVLVNSNLLYIYESNGEIHEINFPFPAIRVIPLAHGGVVIERKEDTLNYDEIPYLYIVLHPLQEPIPIEFDKLENMYLVDMISYETDIAVFYNITSNCFQLYELTEKDSYKYDSPRTPPRTSHLHSEDVKPSLKSCFKSKADCIYMLKLQWTSPVLPTAYGRPNIENMSAFIAMNMTSQVVLCMVNKTASCMVLQNITCLTEKPRFVSCRNAVPIVRRGVLNESENRLKSQLSEIDIIVHQIDHQLALYRGDEQICVLECHSHGKTDSFSIHQCSLDAIFLRQRTKPFNIAYFGHPFNHILSPLLRNIFSVLSCCIGKETVLKFQAEIVNSKIRELKTCKHMTLNVDVKQLDWIIFQKKMLYIAQKVKVEYLDSDADMIQSKQPSFSRATEPSPFELLVKSDYHANYQSCNNLTFVLPTTANKCDNLRETICNIECDKSMLISILNALHLLHEDLKLSVSLHSMRVELNAFLHKFVTTLNIPSYIEYYCQEVSVMDREVDLLNVKEAFLDIDYFPQNIYEWFIRLMRPLNTSSMNEIVVFPTLSESNNQYLWLTNAVTHIWLILFDNHNATQDQKSEEVVCYIVHNNLSSSIEDLPFGIRSIIYSTINKFTETCQKFLEEELAVFIGREDLVLHNKYSHDTVDEVQTIHVNTNRKTMRPHDANADEKRTTGDDGLGDVVTQSQHVFPNDQRINEVARLLRSSRPILLRLEKTMEMSDQDFLGYQQSRLLSLCKRSMALSTARGMLTMGSLQSTKNITSEYLFRIPALPLAGRTPPTNAIVSLDVSGYTKGLEYWPHYHNACAAALRFPSADLSHFINRYWIKYHRPSRSNINKIFTSSIISSSTNSSQPSMDCARAAHAGWLMGLGLRGHLKCLNSTDVYNYLLISNEFITVAVLLGMAATAAHCRRESKARKHGYTHSDDEVAVHGVYEQFTEINTPDIPAASKRKIEPLLVGMGLEMSLERFVSKMLCLHIPSLIPTSSTSFSVPTSAQIAALLGLGILHMGSGHRLMTELLLTEIIGSNGALPSTSSKSSNPLSSASGYPASLDQLESYVLTSGLALGLVTLGLGNKTSGNASLSDLKLEERLFNFIIGGEHIASRHKGRRGEQNSVKSSPTNAASHSLYRGPVSKGLGAFRTPRNLVNVSVTACGSSLALSFMYMKSGNESIAAQLAVPVTMKGLDMVRPDLLMIRTISKNIVLWDRISASKTWVDLNEVPKQLKNAFTIVQQYCNNHEIDSNELPEHLDVPSICQSYANIVTGACFAIGLRYASTQDPVARETIRNYVHYFRDLRSQLKATTAPIISSKKSLIARATDRVTVERCLGVCAQAIALVDAGSCHLDTLSLLRSINLRHISDLDMTYGNHMAYSTALGLLCLGGGRITISRSNEAIAALIISLFPVGPMHTHDNKFHLQALRHLYVLAVDSNRFVEIIDVSTNEKIITTLRVTIRSSNQVKILQSPCLLPEIDEIEQIVISDPKYYQLTLNRKQLIRKTGESFLIRLKQRPQSISQSEIFLTKDKPQSENFVDWRDYFQYYFNGSNNTTHLDWWSNQFQTNMFMNTMDNSFDQYRSKLNAIFAVYTLQRRQPQSIFTTDGLWNLKLLQMNYNKLQKTSQTSEDQENFLCWLNHETEEALRKLWQNDKSKHILNSHFYGIFNYLNDGSSNSRHICNMKDPFMKENSHWSVLMATNELSLEEKQFWLRFHAFAD